MHKLWNHQFLNYCLRVKIDGHTKPQFFPKFLMQVSIRETHNRLVSDPNYGGLKDAIHAENNISISDSTLRSLLSPQCQHNTISCVVVNVIYLTKLYIHCYYHGVIFIFKAERSKLKLSKQKVWWKIKSHILNI